MDLQGYVDLLVPMVYREKLVNLVKTEKLVWTDFQANKAQWVHPVLMDCPEKHVPATRVNKATKENKVFRVNKVNQAFKVKLVQRVPGDNPVRKVNVESRIQECLVNRESLDIQASRANQECQVATE